MAYLLLANANAGKKIYPGGNRKQFSLSELELLIGGGYRKIPSSKVRQHSDKKHVMLVAAAGGGPNALASPWSISEEVRGEAIAIAMEELPSKGAKKS